MSFNNVAGPKLSIKEDKGPSYYQISREISNVKDMEIERNKSREEDEQDMSIEEDLSSDKLSQNIKEKKKNEETQTKRNSLIFSKRTIRDSSYEPIGKSGIITIDDKSESGMNGVSPKANGFGKISRKVSFYDKKLMGIQPDEEESVKSLKKEKSISFNDFGNALNNKLTKGKTIKLLEDLKTEKTQKTEKSKNPLNALQIIRKVKTAITSLRQRAGLQDIKNLRNNHASIINDWAFYQKCDEDVDDEEEQGQNKHAILFQKFVITD
jgi:predicted metal-dependent hydrolase